MHQVEELMIIWGDHLTQERIILREFLQLLYLSICLSIIYIPTYLSIYLPFLYLLVLPIYLDTTFIVEYLKHPQQQRYRKYCNIFFQNVLPFSSRQGNIHGGWALGRLSDVVWTWWNTGGEFPDWHLLSKPGCRAVAGLYPTDLVRTHKGLRFHSSSLPVVAVPRKHTAGSKGNNDGFLEVILVMAHVQCNSILW
jgi:hypothetical protein